MSSLISVLGVDDNPLMCESMERWFHAKGGFRWVGACGRLDEVEALVGASDPDVVLLDLGFPEGSAVALIRRLRAVAPRTRVVVLTGACDQDDVLAAINAGADGYLVKELGMCEIAAAVQRAAAGEHVLSPAARLALRQMELVQ